MTNNYYVVGAYCTSHWVTVIISMKFKEVWYLDSAKQHPPLKFPNLQNVLNRSVSCRFCSQKINLIVFLICIADHAGGLWWCTGQSDKMIGKKAKSHTQAQNKSRYKNEVFLWSLLTYLVLH
jgi:hypothetical protein